MRNSSGHFDSFKTFSDFFVNSIKEIAPNLFYSNGQLHGFWLDPFYYALVRLWNNMLTVSDQMRIMVTKEIEWKDFETLEEMSSMQKVITIMYKLYLDLSQLMFNKTFHDRNYKELWDVYFNVSDIFKNVCEKNNQTSKMFFNKFTICLNEKVQTEWEGIQDENSISDGEAKTTSVDSEKQHTEDITVPKLNLSKKELNKLAKKNMPISPVVDKANEGLSFDDSDPDSDDSDDENKRKVVKEGTFLTFSENFGILSTWGNVCRSLHIIGKSRKPELSRTDFSEIYNTISREFDVYTEFINGPCKKNQEMLLEFIDKLDLAMIFSIINRSIVDLDSPF